MEFFNKWTSNQWGILWISLLFGYLVVDLCWHWLRWETKLLDRFFKS